MLVAVVGLITMLIGTVVAFSSSIITSANSSAMASAVVVGFLIASVVAAAAASSASSAATSSSAASATVSSVFFRLPPPPLPLNSEPPLGHTLPPDNNDNDRVFRAAFFVSLPALLAADDANGGGTKDSRRLRSRQADGAASMFSAQPMGSGSEKRLSPLFSSNFSLEKVTS